MRVRPEAVVRTLGAVATILALSACTAAEPRELGELVVVDSLYVEPGTNEPFSGPVVRLFGDDSGRIELEGSLLNGAFDGELVVYHLNGRVRYMGSFRAGDRCGPWTENADSTDTGSIYEDLVREVETLGLYPPCEGNESS